MTGFDVLWLPGLDFALIATQRAVENDLAAEGLTKQQLGREAFDERVRCWTEENGSAIVAELRTLGASLDWSRLRFTMDAAYVRSVRATFAQLWERGRIYRDFRIVNWCANCSSVLSNRQLLHQPREVDTFSLTVPLKGRGEHIVVTTTRPELIAATAAVVADPIRLGIRDGELAVLPITGETVPVVLDGEACRRAKTDAYLLFTGHDAEHLAVGRRHGLEPRHGLDDRGRLLAPGQRLLDGLPIAEARDRVAKALASGGHLASRVTRADSVALCERCGGEAERIASRQWFVSMKEMAADARSRHDLDGPVFHPARYGDNYCTWLDDMHDWCISRQLWLGPRVPVFTCGCGYQFAAVDDPGLCPKCGSGDLAEDTDVLDAWFSQALWQAAALGWPGEHAELMAYYPTAVAVGSRDSLPLGLSRMVAVSRLLTGEVPFHHAVITCVVLRPDKRKMDSAKGTAIAPWPFIEESGADALRGWAVLSAMTGQDVTFDPGKVTRWRRAITKLWNATQLVVRSSAGDPAEAAGPSAKPHGDSSDLPTRWIISRLNRLITETTDGLETYEFHRSALALLNFIHVDLCNRYLDAVKPRLRAGDRQACRDAVRVFDAVLRLLHPFLPFVSEELWHQLPGDRPMLERCGWPVTTEFPADPAAEAQMNGSQSW